LRQYRENPAQRFLNLNGSILGAIGCASMSTCCRQLATPAHAGAVEPLPRRRGRPPKATIANAHSAAPNQLYSVT
jgi:hypothetical protein